MFLIVGMIMIVAVCGDDSNGNNTLTITVNCTQFGPRDCKLIPRNLPKHICRINVLNFETPKQFLREYMTETYITNITFLEISNNKMLRLPLKGIGSGAFRGLPNLEELHIHLDSLISISNDAFDGLNALKTLNLNGCKGLSSGSLEPALEPPAIPSLENLFVSGIRSLSLHKLLSNRTLRKLDVSKSIIILNINDYSTHCRQLANLEYLNVSAASFVSTSKYNIYRDTELEFQYFNLMFEFFGLRSLTGLLNYCSTNLTNLDMSYSNAYYTIYSAIYIGNKHLKVLNISGLCKPHSTFKIIYQPNDTRDIFYLPSSVFLLCNTEGTIKYVFCNGQSVEVLELAQNHLEFIEPSALALCFKNAVTINLSGNKLVIMMKDHPYQLEILFRPLIHLENIKLSNNDLTEIPSFLFEKNSKLKKIDLSSNKLQTINLHVTHLDHLDVLDLENNAIIVLDSASVSVIDTLPNGPVVNLNSNPLDCSRCADLGFVSWLATSKTLQHKGLTCLRSKTVTFVDDALVAVQMICDDEIKLRLSIGIAVAFLALLSIIILIFYYKRRQSRLRCRQREVKEIKMIIRKKAMFAVFLTYCSEDDEFVKQYVVDNLNQNLKLVIGTDRDLVCEGDRYFRLGMPIMDEISELLDRSGVLVAVLSNNYCQSIFCRNEFQQAIYKEIPILLMLKETVDPDNMSPSMRDMFEKKTRVLWEFEEGEYKLKTTWQNVCQSVVEMIDIKKLRLLTKRRPIIFEEE